MSVTCITSFIRVMLLRTIYFSLLICFIQAIPTPEMNNTFWDVPTGHCEPICTCQMDGLYYNENERWSKPEDPCTTYQCLKNGYYEAVSKGCSYKGDCKTVGEPWTEMCNTFMCVDSPTSPYYKLVEAGCSDTNGQCLKVGERSVLGCDVMECQFDGDCLKIAKVQTGCAVEGNCKRIDTYWHDGCTVYTCANEKEVATKRPLANEIMQWPDGYYAMLKPKTGCPVDVPEVWAEGSRKHYGAGNNFFSEPFNLAGNYTKQFISHEFCNHLAATNMSILPRYKTYWEPGSYCILRNRGKCPRGFTDGYVQFDDNNKKAGEAEQHGMVPDGDYTSDTGLYFCCRKDAAVLKEIVLPKDNSFVLFMASGETECQTARGMQSSIEFFTFDGSVKSRHIHNGTLPALKIDKDDVMIYFCHYKPMECGCADGSGAFIALNTEKVVNCVTKRCISERGFNILDIVSGGCQVEGRCELEHAIWSINHGESCTKQTCKRTTNDTLTTFVVQDVTEGCRDENVCKDLGTDIYRGCYTSRCMVDVKTKKPAFKVLKAGCTNFVGSCVPVGAMLKQGCIAFRCVRKATRCGLVLVRGDCPWLDTCKAVNSTWPHGCMKYRCDMNIDGGHYQWNVQPIEYGCDDGKGNCFKIGENVTGKCYDAVCRLNSNKTVVFLDVTKGGCSWNNSCKKINETWKDGCHDYKCEWTNTETGFTAIINATNVSCQWNNTCYKQDEVWSDGCVDYTCAVNRSAAEVNWSVDTINIACTDFKGKCLAVGHNITEKCVNYTCQHDGNNLGLITTSVACEWDGGCQPENATWTDTIKCVDYQCRKRKGQTGSVMQISVVDYGCTFNNTCKPVNATWPDGCRTRKCVVARTKKFIQRSTAAIAAGCDDEGVCRPVGYKKITNTCREYECAFKQEFKDAFFTLSGGACRSTSGQCYMVNNTWEEKQEGICVTYKCQKEKVGYLSKVIKQKCRDSDGKCQPVGSTGFPVVVKGKLRRNCRCVKGTLSIGVRCKTNS